MTLTLTHAELRQFRRSDDRFRHPASNKVRYTAGVKYLADHGAFHCVLNSIVCDYDCPAVVAAAEADPRLARAQLWQLHNQRNRSATLSVRAGHGEEVVYSRPLFCTSCPLQHIEVWAVRQGDIWILCLPSEV